MSTDSKTGILEAADAEATEPRATPRKMRAIVRDGYGSPDVLRVAEIPVPEVGADDVLVRVRAASVDRGAWHIMTGLPYLIRPMGFGVRAPRNPGLGTDLSGIVEAVGPNVTEVAPGDEVYGMSRASFAEFVVADPGRLARKPANLTFEQAAAVPVSGVTALQGLRDAGQLQAGQRVLVIGASGGVGIFSVQIAKALGAHVTGVCSTTKVDLVRSVGADEVIDYRQSDIGERQPYELVLDIGGNRRLSQLRRVLTRNGRLVIVGGENGGRWTGGFGRQLRAVALSPFVHQHLGMLSSSENGADLDVLRDLIEAGSVTPVIDRVVGLPDVAQAIRDLASGALHGKVVILP